MIPIIIIFIILIVGVIIWQLLPKTHHLRLSSQEFPELSLKVLISKKERKIDKLYINTLAKKEITIESIKFELISLKREFKYIDSNQLSNEIFIPVVVKPSTVFNITFLYDELKTLINNTMTPLHSFRVVLELNNNKVFKSHELKFDNFWKIYKSDSGRYN